ncbi:MAG: hypothetical protein Q9226_007418, partial [Calogaya cf. arnoldii]
MLPIVGNIPAAAKKTPKYLMPTVLQAARSTYPMKPMVDITITVIPRCCVLSAIYAEMMVTGNDSKKGGAVKPCAFTL